MDSNIYSFTFDYMFRNIGIEKKYIKQLTTCFRPSFNSTLVLLLLVLFLESLNYWIFVISSPLLFTQNANVVRLVFFIISIGFVSSTFLSLVADWVIYVFTPYNRYYFFASNLIKLGYWAVFAKNFDLQLVIFSCAMIYFTITVQVRLRNLWVSIEKNKRKVVKKQFILNEIQEAVLKFDFDGNLVSLNNKGKKFMETRNKNPALKCKYNDLFPEDSLDRIKKSFDLAVLGKNTAEEFLLGNEEKSILPPFSAVLISFSLSNYNNIQVVQFSISNIAKSLTKRQFLAANQRQIEENTCVLEEEFMNLYFCKVPLKNKHMINLNYYLLMQKDSSVLMEYYIGENESINEFFDIKKEIVNTVHSCSRAAKAKNVFVSLECEQVIPCQVFGDYVKHNQILKSMTDFMVLVADLNSNALIECSQKLAEENCLIEYKFTFQSSSLKEEELFHIFRYRKNTKSIKTIEEIIEIGEKYGIGISLLDTMLSIVDGYFTKTEVQDKINRSIIIYM